MILKRRRYAIVEQYNGEWYFINHANNRTRGISVKNVGNSELQLYVSKKKALNALWNNKVNKVVAVDVTIEIVEGIE